MSSTSLSDAASFTSQDSCENLIGKRSDDGKSFHSDGSAPDDFISNCSEPIKRALNLVLSDRSLTRCLRRLVDTLEKRQWIVTQRQDSALSGSATFSEAAGQGLGVRLVFSWRARLSAMDEFELKRLQERRSTAADIAATRLDLLKSGGRSYWSLQVFDPAAAVSRTDEILEAVPRLDGDLRSLLWETVHKGGDPPVSMTRYKIMDGQARIDLRIGSQATECRVVDENGEVIANPLSMLPLPLNGAQEDWQKLLEGLKVTDGFDKHQTRNPILPWSASLEESGYVWSIDMLRMLNTVAEHDSITSAYTAAQKQDCHIPTATGGIGHTELTICTPGVRSTEAYRRFAYLHTDKIPPSAGNKPKIDLLYQLDADRETMTRGLCTRFTMSEIGLEDVGGEREPFTFNWGTTWRWVPQLSWQSNYSITCGKASVMMSCNADGTVYAFARDSNGKVVENPAQSLPAPGDGRDEFWEFPSF